jgi:hypothetical protein
MNRSKRYVFATALALPMFYLAGCRPGGGLTAPFDFPLGSSLGTFDVVAGESTQNAGPGTLSGNSRDVRSASVSLDPDAITFTPSDGSGSKGVTTHQTGATFTVTTGIGGADELDTVCETPVDEYGPFLVTLDADFNVTSITPQDVPLTQSSLDLINSGSFSICLTVDDSTVSGTLTIESLAFELGL